MAARMTYDKRKRAGERFAYRSRDCSWDCWAKARRVWATRTPPGPSPCSGGTWHAPDYPRLFFARSQASLPVLHKLYVVHPTGDEDLTKSDPYRTFAADLAVALGRPFAK